MCARVCVYVRVTIDFFVVANNNMNMKKMYTLDLQTQRATSLVTSLEGNCFLLYLTRIDGSLWADRNGVDKILGRPLGG